MDIFFQKWNYQGTDYDDGELAKALVDDMSNHSGKISLFRGGCYFRLEWRRSTHKQDNLTAPEGRAIKFSLTAIDQMTAAGQERTAGFAAFRESGPATANLLLGSPELDSIGIQNALTGLVSDVAVQVWPDSYPDPSAQYRRP
jgi:hypothetical protein